MQAVSTPLPDGQSPAPPDAKDAVAEANHRIANSLTLLVSMVRIQARTAARTARPLTGPEVEQLLGGIAARISTIGQLHRLLSHVPPDGCISLQPHLRDVGAALVAALSAPGQIVQVEHRGGDCLVPGRHVQPIILIVCEAFINAMKYAHPAGVPLVMTLDCTLSADGRPVLIVGDDGVGLPEGFDPERDGGMGLRVMRSLAAEIGASLDIASTGLGLNVLLSLKNAAGVKLS